MRLWIFLGIVALFSQPVTATELVHRFVNPNFGGNPLNGNFLMSQAGDQNNTKDSVSPTTPANALKDFTDRLKSSVLSGLARSASNKLVDENGNIIPNNTLTIGDFSVSVGDEVNGAVTINVSDGISSTQLTIPSINSTPTQ